MWYPHNCREEAAQATALCVICMCTCCPKAWDRGLQNQSHPDVQQQCNTCRVAGSSKTRRASAMRGLSSLGDSAAPGSDSSCCNPWLCSTCSALSCCMVRHASSCTTANAALSGVLRTVLGVAGGCQPTAQVCRRGSSCKHTLSARCCCGGDSKPPDDHMDDTSCCSLSSAL